ncbi:hypothetical protein LSAT2_028015 [Lamellibrachia satsuma]|nr:hypothetical protein LSAT2_028015 [Lamellibrachia satsuma]
MRFPKFALWLCASLLLVALTATADDVNAPETAAGPTPAETADAPADTPAETADAPADAPAEMADVPADAPAETVDAPAEALDETEDAPADAPAEMADAPAETADAPTDTLAEIAEAPADIPAAEKADEPVGEPIVEEPIVAAKSPQTAGLVPDDIPKDGEDTESEDDDDAAVAAAAAEDEVPDEVSEGGDVEAGPIETATELSPDDMKKETEEEDDEAAETAAAAVEEKEAESEVTEETEPEVIEPIAAGTDTPPEGDTDETTESAPKVEVINAAVATESSDVVEEEPTSVALIASSDVKSSPSEAPEAAVSSESEEVTAAEATTPAPVPEVAVETGSGAVAKENVTTGTSALTSTESNATVETTKTLPEKLVEDDKAVDGEMDEEEIAVYEVEFYDLFDEQQKNIVTLELNSGSTDLNEAYYLAVTQAIADKLSPLLFNGTDSGVLTYLAPSPQGGDGWMQLCIVMKVGIEGAVPQDDLLEGIQTLNLTSFGLSVLKIYAGMPTYGLKVMEYKDLSKAQQSGVVTLELDYAGALLNDEFFKNVIITVAAHYPADVPAEGSLVFVAPTPVVTNGLLQMILVSEIGEEGAVPVKDFMQTLKKLNLSEAGLIVISMKPGMPPTGIQVVELRELSVDQLEGIVTIELDRGANRVLQNEYSIAVAVREMRAMFEDEGLSGDIVFVAPTPVEDNDKIQAAFIVRPAKYQAVHQDKLLQAVRKIDLTKIGVTLANSYTGMPTYGLPIVGYTDLTEAKRDGIVTVVMDTGDKTTEYQVLHARVCHSQ